MRWSSTVAVGIVAVIIAGLVLGGVAAAGRRDWTGSMACGSCHPAQLAAWQRTAHATTARRLPVRPETRCLACHATGEAPAGPAIAIEVGCEACHGAGAHYAADDVMRNPVVARALGLVDIKTPRVRDAVCTGCHARSTRSTAFDRDASPHPTYSSTPATPAAPARPKSSP